MSGTRAPFLRARRSSRIARATPIPSLRSPLASPLAGAAARPRARVGGEPVACHVCWLGLPPGHCLLHALCLQKNCLALMLC